MTTSRFGLVVALSIGTLAASACGGDAETATGNQVDPVRDVLTDTGRNRESGPVLNSEAYDVPLSYLIDSADLFVTGTIVSVEPPRWNSVDGLRYEFESGAEVPVLPLQYRVVTLAVEDVHVGSTDAERVSFLLWGSGEAQGGAVSASDDGTDDYDLLSGEMLAGERRLVALRRFDLWEYGADEPRSVLSNMEYAQGHWLYDGDGLMSSRPGRSFEVASELLDLIESHVAGSRQLLDLEAAGSPLGVTPALERPADLVLVFNDEGMFRCEGADCSESSREWQPLPPADETQNTPHEDLEPGPVADGEAFVGSTRESRYVEVGLGETWNGRRQLSCDFGRPEDIMFDFMGPPNHETAERAIIAALEVHGIDGGSYAIGPSNVWSDGYLRAEVRFDGTYGQTARLSLISDGSNFVVENYSLCLDNRADQ